MDRRKFLAIGGATAVAGTREALPHVTDYPHKHWPGDWIIPEQKLMRRIPSSGEMVPAVGLGTSGPFEVGADRAAPRIQERAVTVR